jgi:hypothetical protein
MTYLCGNWLIPSRMGSSILGLLFQIIEVIAFKVEREAFLGGA